MFLRFYMVYVQIILLDIFSLFGGGGMEQNPKLKN